MNWICKLFGHRYLLVSSVRGLWAEIFCERCGFAIVSIYKDNRASVPETREATQDEA